MDTNRTQCAELWASGRALSYMHLYTASPMEHMRGTNGGVPTAIMKRMMEYALGPAANAAGPVD